MRINIAATAVALCVPACLLAQATAVQNKSPEAKPNPMMVAATPSQRQAFESGLKGTLPGGIVQMNVQLAWTSYPTAPSYRVLRYRDLSSTPAVVANSISATQLNSAVLPGYPFVFRVVALDGKGMPLDTTTGVRVTPPAVPPSDQTTHGSTYYPPILPATCTMSAPGTIKLAWGAVPTASDYAVMIQVRNGQTISPIVNTNTTATSFTQNGLGAGFYYTTVTANYVMQDYPVPGQSTHFPMGYFRDMLTLPPSAPGTCH